MTESLSLYLRVTGMAEMQHLRGRQCSLQIEKPAGESFKIICMLFWNLLCK